MTINLRLSRDQKALAAIIGAYCVSGLVGLQFGFITRGVTAVWPPAGIALAAFIVLGYRVWPAVLIGAFAVYGISLKSLPVSLAIAIGNTAEGLLGAYLVNRFAGGRSALQNPQNTLRFAALAVLAGTTVSASVAATSLAVSGLGLWSEYGAMWTTICVGNIAGCLIVAPVAMLWGTGSWTVWRPSKTVEAALLFVSLILVGLVVFCGIPPLFSGFPVEFLCVPVLVWAAFSLGRREAALAILLLSMIAIVGTLTHHGPFVRETPNESLLWLLAFMSVFGVMTMALAALASEYQVAETQLRALVVTDPLTGLPNYRRLVEVLQAEILRADRIERPFSVVFFDMDGLKAINDEFGHLAGSRAVCRVADTLRESCRATDTSARFGGDEFVVVLPDTDETGARHVVRRVSERLAKDNDKPKLSVSAGVAVYPRDGSTPATLLSSADRVLYKVKGEKSEGRKADVVTVREWSGTAVR